MRITQKFATSTLVYSSPTYNATINASGTRIDTEKHVGDGARTLATIDGTGLGARYLYNHPDHLTGANALTTGARTFEQVLDYMPFGGVRVDAKAGSWSEQRQYAGHDFDQTSGYSYMKARYYDPQVKRFASQDPVFWELNLSEAGKLVLMNPQMLNSYSYSVNSPIVNRDPDGRLSWGALLSNAIESYKRTVNWWSASLGLNIIDKPFSAELLRHSVSLEPSDLHIDEGNQKRFGNPINKIKDTVQYKLYAKQTIEGAKNGKMTNTAHFAFEDRSDLYYSLHGADIETQVTNENGQWVLTNTVTDRYDFNEVNLNSYKGKESVTRIPAAQAYKDQGNGYLSNFNVKIQFKDKIKN